VTTKSDFLVDQEKAITLLFSPSLAPGLDLPPITDNVRVKEMITKRKKNIFIFTLNGVADEFVRDEAIFDEVVRSIRWLH